MVKKEDDIISSLIDDPENELFRYGIEERVVELDTGRVGAIQNGFCRETQGSGAFRVTYLVEFEDGQQKLRRPGSIERIVDRLRRLQGRLDRLHESEALETQHGVSVRDPESIRTSCELQEEIRELKKWV